MRQASLQNVYILDPRLVEHFVHIENACNICLYHELLYITCSSSQSQSPMLLEGDNVPSVILDVAPSRLALALRLSLASWHT